MAKVPIWTSTRNSIDKDSEDGYIETYSNDLVRIENEHLAALNPESMDLQKSFDVKVLVRVPSSWMEKTVPKLLDIAESGLDLSMKHIRLEVSGTTLKMYAVTSDRAFYTKTDIEMNQSPGSVQDFGVVVSVEQLRTVHGFLSKTFGSGACELGVSKPSDNCDALLIVCYNKISDNEVEPNSPRTATPGQKVKAAMFKLERSSGEFPLGIFEQPEFAAKFTASVVPALRWVFGQKNKYVELRSNNGVLEAQYENGERSVRTSLGAKIVTSESLSELDGLTLASVDGTYMLDIFNYVKASPIQLTFGTITKSGKEKPSFLYAESPEMGAVIAQSYRQDLPEGVTYITRKKGKLEETTEKEATDRAMKQNKKGNEAAPIVAEIPTTPAPEEQLREIVIPQPMLDNLKDCEEMAKTQIEALPDDLLRDIAQSLRTIIKILSGGTAVPAPAVVAPPVKTAPALTPPDPVPMDLDAILAWMAQRIGEEFAVSVIKGTLPNIKDNTISAAISKLGRIGVLIPVRRGLYKIPEDFRERCARIPRKGKRPPV